MTELKKLLRETFQRRRYGNTPGDYDPDIDLLDVAADEIERLTAENERLRALLQEIAAYKLPHDVTGETGLAYVKVMASRAHQQQITLSEPTPEQEAYLRKIEESQC